MHHFRIKAINKSSKPHNRNDFVLSFYYNLFYKMLLMRFTSHVQCSQVLPLILKNMACIPFNSDISFYVIHCKCQRVPGKKWKRTTTYIMRIKSNHQVARETHRIIALRERRNCTWQIEANVRIVHTRKWLLCSSCSWCSKMNSSAWLSQWTTKISCIFCKIYTQ